ncbi:MAG: hypothetical protein J7497_13085, partial [Chitinophagaceae bacterium]|nr:hypothetical protein [Chitinophagaceae bacterium]
MRSDIITIVPTFHKRLKYIPFVEKAIDIYLTINAHRAYISDVEIATISRTTFVSKKKEWAEIILEGIVELGKQYEFQYVFLLLEDLVPFKEVPVSVVDNHLALMKKYDYKSIVFSTYPKEWMDDSFSSTIIDGMDFYEIPHSFKFYSQLQPGIWNKEYLQTILRTLISEKKFSPWEFE